MAAKCIVLSVSDNVAVTLEELNEGDQVAISFSDGETVVEIKEHISFGHKFALGQIAKGGK
jgi:exonuclease VII large subunit